MSDQTTNIAYESPLVSEDLAFELRPCEEYGARTDSLEYSPASSLVWDDGFAIDDACEDDYFGIDLNDGLSNDWAAALPGLPAFSWQDGSLDLDFVLQSCTESSKTHAASTNVSQQPRSDSAVSFSTFDTGEPSSPIHTRTCRICGLVFESGYLLEDHAKDAKHATYVCLQKGCGKSYRRRDVLRRHVATHDRTEFVCPICSQAKRRKVFQRRDNLSQHIRIRHPKLYGIWKRSSPVGSRAKYSPILTEAKGFGSIAALNYISEPSRSSAKTIPPEHSSTDMPMADESHSTTADKVASALGSILGDNDHIVVQVIQQRVDLQDQSVTEELAAGLAKLTLKKPEQLPETARAQLEETMLC